MKKYFLKLFLLCYSAIGICSNNNYKAKFTLEKILEYVFSDIQYALNYDRRFFDFCKSNKDNVKLLSNIGASCKHLHKKLNQYESMFNENSLNNFDNHFNWIKYFLKKQKYEELINIIQSPNFDISNCFISDSKSSFELELNILFNQLARKIKLSKELKNKFEESPFIFPDYILRCLNANHEDVDINNLYEEALCDEKISLITCEDRVIQKIENSNYFEDKDLELEKINLACLRKIYREKIQENPILSGDIFSIQKQYFKKLFFPNNHKNLSGFKYKILDTIDESVFRLNRFYDNWVHKSSRGKKILNPPEIRALDPEELEELLSNIKLDYENLIDKIQKIPEVEEINKEFLNLIRHSHFEEKDFLPIKRSGSLDTSFIIVISLYLERYDLVEMLCNSIPNSLNNLDKTIDMLFKIAYEFIVKGKGSIFSAESCQFVMRKIPNMMETLKSDYNNFAEARNSYLKHKKLYIRLIQMWLIKTAAFGGKNNFKDAFNFVSQKNLLNHSISYMLPQRIPIGSAGLNMPGFFMETWPPIFFLAYFFPEKTLWLAREQALEENHALNGKDLEKQTINWLKRYTIGTENDVSALVPLLASPFIESDLVLAYLDENSFSSDELTILRTHLHARGLFNRKLWVDSILNKTLKSQD